MEHRLQKEDLEKLVHLRGLKHGVVLHRINKHYCHTMRYRGLCPRMCVEGCGETIQKIVNVRGDDRVASMVWAAREAAAEAIEKAGEERIEIRGSPGNMNVFERILSTL